MHDPKLVAVIVVLSGVFAFVAGWLAKLGWDIREGGARAQLEADAFERGRAAAWRCPGCGALDDEDCRDGCPYAPCPECGSHFPCEHDGDQADSEVADGDWSETLAAIPSVPPHEPEAAPVAVTLPRLGNYIRHTGMIYRDPATDGAAALELAGQLDPSLRDLYVAGALELAAAVTPPCPRCGGNRWRTIVKGRRWACRECGYERGETDGDDRDSADAPHGGADGGRVGATDADHATGLAGGPPPVDRALAAWDARAAERCMTLAERAELAAFRVWETEVGAAITAAYDWLGEPVPPRGQVRRLELAH